MEVIDGQVTGVVDGDSLLVADARKVTHRIELHGIDAPELRQAYGENSRKNLARLASGKTVRADCVRLEHRDYKLCTVWTYPADCTACGFTLDLGLVQILQGYAWHFSASEIALAPETEAQYATAESEARKAKAGLWGDEAPVAPWDWRKSGRGR